MKNKSTPENRRTFARRDLTNLHMLHAARNWSKADVLAGEQGGVRFVVKDLRGRPLWFRVLYGRATLRREWKVLRALDGTNGVPRVLARPDADALVIEYVEGTPIQDLPRAQINEAILNRVAQLVDALHARGVTHGDLHQDNILVREDGSVTFIDWATAHDFGAKLNPATRKIFDELRALDLRAVYKLKVFYAKHLLSREEHDFLAGGGSSLYAAVKKVRGKLDKARGKKNSGVFESKLRDAESLLDK